MSLILEALRKIEREKQVPERGLVVTGATVWAAPEPRHGLRLALVALGGVLLGGGLWLGLGRTALAPAPPSPAASAPAPRAETAPPSPFTAPVPADHAATAPTLAAPIPVPGAAARHAAGPPPARPRLPARDTPPAPTSLTADGAHSSASEPGVADGATPDSPAPTAGPEDVVLQAVTERDGQPLAIVNGRLVREGDTFDGLRILRIRPSEIEIEIGGRRRTVGF